MAQDSTAVLSMEERLLIIRCSWCGKYLREDIPYEDKSVSHTICEPCYQKFFPDEYEQSYLAKPADKITITVLR